MNIYLVPRRKGRYLLLSNEFQTEPRPETSEQSPSKRRFLSLLKSGYQSATAKRNRSEKLLKEMTALSQITVHYPANISEEDARNIYDKLIQSQIKKHKRWLIVDGALLPVSVIFSLVPGPNLLMAYLAWRALAHYKSKKGAEKAIADLKISFVKEPELETLFVIVNKKFVFSRRHKIKAIGDKIGVENLDRLV